MKHKLHITLFVVLMAFICLLISCGRSMEKQESIAVMNDEIAPPAGNELEQTFETDTLNTEQLDVFQERARQKLSDFINYIEIISDKTYDPQLRLEARKQVSELFSDSTIPVNVSIDQRAQAPKTIAMFLNEVYQCEYDSIKIKTDSVIVGQPHKTSESMTYSGIISAKIHILGYKNSNVSFESTATHQAATIIHKTSKKFGGDNKEVWTVAIGELK